MIGLRAWLDTKQETRLKIAKLFHMPKSGGTMVTGNRVTSDGHSPDDLALLTLEALQMHLGVPETDFYKLYYELVFRIENPDEVRLDPRQVIAPITSGLAQKVEVKEPKIGKPDFLAVHKEKRVKGCTVCGSKGWRHKSECRLSELTETHVPQQAQAINAEVI